MSNRVRSETGYLRGKGAGRRQTARIDLGLALLSLACPSYPLSLTEIAAWCGCTDSAILLIEQKALRKLRTALYFHHDEKLIDLAAWFFDHRTTARATLKRAA